MRIGIANDTALAREALRRVVLSSPEHEVVWTADDGAEAIAMARANPADLILMDLLMPGVDGVEATRRIMGESPCAILVVTATVSGHLGQVYQAMGYGALDAIDTPRLGPRGEISGAAVLLHKIELIGRLVGPPAPDRTGRAGTGAGASRTESMAGARGSGRAGRWTPWSSWAPRPAARRPWPRSSAGSRRGSRPGSSSCSTWMRRSRRAGPLARRAGAAAGHADRARAPAGRRRGPARRHRRPPHPRRRTAGCATRPSRSRPATGPRLTSSSTAWRGTGRGRASRRC